MSKEKQAAVRLTNVSKNYMTYAKPRYWLADFLGLGRFLQEGRHYRSFWALRDINLEIPVGGRVAFIGRNGAGKSTLLRIISDNIAPTTGTVEVNGRCEALLELGSGFNPVFTGRENVYLNGAILGFSRQEMDERFDEIAVFADIGQFIDQPVKHYSSGMFVRLAFAVTAHRSTWLTTMPGTGDFAGGRGATRVKLIPGGERNGSSDSGCKRRGHQSHDLSVATTGIHDAGGRD